LPAQGSSVKTWTPTLQAVATPATDGRRSSLEFELAFDSDFTALVTSVPVPGLRASGTVTATVPFAQKLPQQGLWYLRARQTDEYGKVGPWSAAVSFDVNHQPNAVGLSPSSGQPLVFQHDLEGVLFSWAFNDSAPGDSQSAYQVEIRYATGEMLHQSEVVETDDTTDLLVPLDWAAVQEDFFNGVNYQWRVKVWDSQGEEGSWAPWVTVVPWLTPAIAVTNPPPGIIDNGKPFVEWNEVGINQNALQRYEVRYIRTSDNVLVWSSGWQTPYVESYQPKINVLENEKTYRIEVLTQDRFGFEAQGAVNVTTSYVAPPNVEFFVDTESFRLNGFLLVNWSATEADTYFITWNIYRRRYGTTNWELVHAESNPEVHEFSDWMVLSGELYDYAVTQVADRSGLTFESAIAPTSSPAAAVGEQYWLMDPVDPRNNLLLFNVTADEFTDSVEQEDYLVIGRGMRTDYGTDIGVAGTLSAQIRDKYELTAADQFAQLQKIRRQRSYFLLRNPFGQMIQVSLGNLSASRLPGVGRSAYMDVSIPYQQVV
jgi:hypothetical protein